MADEKDLMEGFEDEGAVLTLTDEEGNEVEFELLDVVEYDGNEYIVLIENEEDADEVVIFRIHQLDEENEEYISIDDEDLLQKVFEIFKSRNGEYIDFE